MAYSLKDTDETIAAGMRRIARSQIEKAIAELDEDALSRQDTIHQVRKRCKKVRGLLRLVRPGFAAYKDENIAFRDAARRLSDYRDSTTLIETSDRIATRFATMAREQTFNQVHDRLLEHRRRLDDNEVDEALARFRADMVRALDRSADWTLDPDSFEAIRKGVRKTYKRACKMMAEADEARTGEVLHEWRKRVKYHWYHARLLKHISPVMAPHVSLADQLAGLLGDHHDLVVFAQTLADPALGLDQTQHEFLYGLICGHQRTLEDDAFTLGQKLLAEKPGHLAERWARYWTEWQAEAVG